MGAVMHDLRLIHTDLKPEENILLVSPEYIKVPDYNGSYRSPKVVHTPKEYQDAVLSK
ncbi:putative dual-specificity kinase [Helianthus annuus]|uniref:Dual-specificity kinase n=1 Tax=Helianthus annuus TaxID=4232 RepID=A0A9K3NPT5_HELAN|nr:putative dual-specificity kinase [Helianthus annuus]